jgi:hypothetical protein
MSDDKNDEHPKDEAVPGDDPATGTRAEDETTAAKDEPVDAEIVNDDPKADGTETTNTDVPPETESRHEEPARSKKGGGVLTYAALGAVTAAIVAGIVIYAEDREADPIASTDGIIIAEAEEDKVLFPLTDEQIAARRSAGGTGAARVPAATPQPQEQPVALPAAEESEPQSPAEAEERIRAEDTNLRDILFAEPDTRDDDQAELAQVQPEPQPEPRPSRAEGQSAETENDRSADSLIAALNARAGEALAAAEDAGADIADAAAEDEPQPADDTRTAEAGADEATDADAAARARVRSLRQLALRRAEERQRAAEARETAPAPTEEETETRTAEAPGETSEPSTESPPEPVRAEEPARTVQAAATPQAVIPEERIETLRREIVEDVSTIVRDVSDDVRQGVKTEVLAETENRFAETEQALQQTERRIEELQSDITQQQREAKAQLSQLDSRIEELRVRDVAVAQRGALLVALTELTESIEAGRPFRRQLNNVQSITGDRRELSVIAPFADEGLPTEESLQERFDEAARRALANEKKEDADDVFSRFAANVASLFTVRPTGEAEGDSAGAIIARAELDLDNGDVGAAVDELRDLDGMAAEAFDEWIAAAEARAAADRGIMSLEQQVVTPRRG